MWKVTGVLCADMSVYRIHSTPKYVLESITEMKSEVQEKKGNNLIAFD